MRCRPHKVAICQHLDDLTEDGRNIGACNTVIVRKGPNGERKLVGHNTECVAVSAHWLATRLSRS